MKAGCLIGRKLEGRSTEPEEVELDLDDAAPLEDFDEIDTGLPMPPNKMPSGSVLQEVSDGDVIDEESQELDAFIEGKNRPAHLGGETADDLDELDELDDGEIGAPRGSSVVAYMTCRPCRRSCSRHSSGRAWCCSTSAVRRAACHHTRRRTG